MSSTNHIWETGGSGYWCNRDWTYILSKEIYYIGDTNYNIIADKVIEEQDVRKSIYTHVRRAHSEIIVINILVIQSKKVLGDHSSNRLIVSI